MPLGYLFSIVWKQDITGIWEGMLIGVVMQALQFSVALSCLVNWEKMAEKIHDRFKKSLSMVEQEEPVEKQLLLTGLAILERSRANSHMLYDFRQFRSVIE